MSNFLLILQVVLAIGLILVVLMQGRGSGLSPFAGSTFYARRGFEKVLFGTTIVLTVFLVGVLLGALFF